MVNLVKKSNLLILIYLLLTFSSVVRAERNIVFTFGNSEFSDKNFGPLNYSKTDARAIFQFFKNSWGRRNEKFSGKYHEDSSLKEFNDQLKKINQLNEKESDTIIIYLSTHGTLGFAPFSGQVQKYLVFKDTNSRKLEKTSLSLDKLFLLFNNLKSKKKALIIDSCFSGEGKSYLTKEFLEKKKGTKGFVTPYELFSSKQGEVILFSGQANEISRESSELGHSIYTFYLLEGMRKDLNNDGVITLTEAHSYATARTQIHTNYQQNPTSRVNFSGVDPILIKGRMNKSNSLIKAIRPENKLLEVIINGKNRGRASKGIIISSGTKRIVLKDPRNGKEVLNTYFSFLGGKEYMISNLFFAKGKELFLSIGYGNLNYIDSKKDQFASEMAHGVELSITRKNILGSLFGEAELGYFWSEEGLSATSTSVVNQERNHFVISLSTGKFKQLSSLSSNKGTVITNFKYKLGVLLKSTQTTRKISNSNNPNLILQNQESSTVWKLGFRTGLSFELTSFWSSWAGEFGLDLGGSESPYINSRNRFLWFWSSYFKFSYGF